MILSISDQGLDSQRVPKIFDSSTELIKAESRAQSGTGLDAAIAKRNHQAMDLSGLGEQTRFPTLYHCSSLMIRML